MGLYVAFDSIVGSTRHDKAGRRIPSPF